jgi:hypothetical protein
MVIQNPSKIKSLDGFWTFSSQAAAALQPKPYLAFIRIPTFHTVDSR